MLDVHPPHPVGVASVIELKGISRKSPNPAQAGLPSPGITPNQPLRDKGLIDSPILIYFAPDASFILCSTCLFHMFVILDSPRDPVQNLFHNSVIVPAQILDRFYIDVGIDLDISFCGLLIPSSLAHSSCKTFKFDDTYNEFACVYSSKKVFHVFPDLIRHQFGH